MTAPQIKVKVIRRPQVKLKVLPRFPSSVTAASPITLDTTGGNYEIGLSVNDLQDSLDLIYAPIGVGVGGSDTQLQYNDNGSFGGTSGATTDGTKLTLVAPILGTPTSGTLTNCTGLPVSTGISGLASGAATFLATPSSANLRSLLTDESGTGAAYFQGGDAGTPSALVGTNITGTATGLTAGTATNAVNSGITNDTTTNATMYPAWVTASTGNVPLKVSSTKMYWNPSSSLLTISRNSTAFTPPGSTTGLFIQGGDTGEARIDIDACASDAVVGFNRLNGSFASPTKVVAGNQMMGLPSGGIDTNASTTMQQGGSIGSYATADWSSTSHPTEFRFYTIPTGSTSLLEAMRVLDTGGAWLGKNTTTNVPNSFAAGTPTLQLHGNNSADNYSVMDAYGTGVAPYGVYRTARGTAASFTATQSGDTLGGFGWVGATGANTFANPFPFGAAGGAFILSSAKEAWSGSAQGANLQIYTTPLTTNTVAISLCCQASGGVSVGSAATAKDYGAGNLYLNGGFASAAPTTKTTNYTMTVADSSLIFNNSGGSTTLTLLSAATYPGRELWLKTHQAQTVVSASSNVVPQAGGAAGTAILAATAGKWAFLKSDGTNWQIMASN